MRAFALDFCPLMSWIFGANFLILCVHVQFLVRLCLDYSAFCPNFNAFMSRLLCVIIRPWSIHAFRFKLSCVLVQTLERSSSHFFIRSCSNYHVLVCRLFYFQFQTLQHLYLDLSAIMSIFSCVYVETLVSFCSDFKVFMFTLSHVQAQNFRR